MVKGHKQIDLKIATKRRFDDLKGKRSADKFVNELLDIYLSKTQAPSQLLSDTKMSKTSYDTPECPFRAIDLEKGQWYCAGKKIPKVVCTRRQQRYIKTKEGCFPQSIAKHCRRCGREIRPKYTYCYNCKLERDERKADKDGYLPDATQPFFGDII